MNNPRMVRGRRLSAVGGEPLATAKTIRFEETTKNGKIIVEIVTTTRMSTKGETQQEIFGEGLPSALTVRGPAVPIVTSVKVKATIVQGEDEQTLNLDGENMMTLFSAIMRMVPNEVAQMHRYGPMLG